jgi:two-component system response regulator RegX3
VSGRILLVDDEPAIVDAVSYALEGEGFEVESRSDGEAALSAALGERFDLVLLDLMIPKLSGTEVCRRLRAESDVPIVMLTAKDAEVDRVLGLEIGADDYAGSSTGRGAGTRSGRSARWRWTSPGTRFPSKATRCS